MTPFIETGVLIVGGGPVGLTLAMDLARRGIEVTVLELRRRGEPPSVKCNHVAARSMELFRRLGVARQVRDAGLPADYPNDISYRTTMLGGELTRIPIPCRRDRYTAKGGPDAWWPTPEPPHRINQIFLEPILFEHASKLDRVTIHNRVEFLGFTQDDDGVTATARAPRHGREARPSPPATSSAATAATRRSRRASARGSLGDAVVQRVQSTYIRAPDLLAPQEGPAWVNFSLNPRRSGNAYAIDGRETWLVHNYLRQDEADFDSVDRDWAICAILGVGADFDYEVLSKEDWFGRRLRRRQIPRRPRLHCGDAAHLWVPYAGYGMNAGFADAADLAWLLAADLDGWGGPAMLDAYEAERRRSPSRCRVSPWTTPTRWPASAAACRRRSRTIRRGRRRPGGSGAARLRPQRPAVLLRRPQLRLLLRRSPIIAYDGEAQPPYSMGAFTPSTVPGCRVPHIRLQGRTLALRRDGPRLHAASPRSGRRGGRPRRCRRAARRAAGAARHRARRGGAAHGHALSWRGRTSMSPGAATPCRPTRWR